MLRHALRGLLRSPGFTLVALLSLALGIGANTAIFSLIDAVMLRTLPVREPEELVRVTFSGDATADFTNPLWESIRDRADVFDGSFAYTNQRFDLAGGGEARPVEGNWVSGEFFNVLGVAPTVGRVLGPADDVAGCPATVVLSHGFWRSEFGGDPGVVGRTLALDGHPFEVVGVAREGFFGFDVGHATQLFAPLCARAVLEPPTGGLDNNFFWFLQVAGRLREGVGFAAARSRIQALAPEVYGAVISPDASDLTRASFEDGTLDLAPAANGHSPLRGNLQAALIAMMVVVGVVLLIACANVANLLLARATVRQREMAIRRAIGAGRGHLVRQLLAESLLLAFAGAILGVLLAMWASEAIVAAMAQGRSGVWLDVSLNLRVLAFTAAIAIGTAILFGLAPAWRSSRVDPQAAMKENDRSVTGSRRRVTLGRALVVGQITLSLVLVMAAGLLLESFRRLSSIDPGFDAEGVLIAQLELQRAGYAAEQIPSVKREVLERVRGSAGVMSAAASEIVPLSGAGWNGPVEVAGFVPQHERDAVVFFNAVTDDFFATLRTPLIAGRDFGSGDREGTSPVAVVNEAFVEKFFAGRNPIGERIRRPTPWAPAEEQPAVEVVGVVRNTKYRSLREQTEPLIYVPLGQAGHEGPTLVMEIRGAGGAEALRPVVERVAAEMNPRISLTFSHMADAVATTLGRERLLASLSALFGGLALLLAVIGLYGTMAYSVARRRGELGIRMALGADRRRVMRLVAGEAGRLVISGLVLGAVVALLASRLVAAFLYGLSPNDPATLAVSALLIAAVTMAAGAVPAWKAAKADPMAALRE